jgi:hypothetical protein
MELQSNFCFAQLHNAAFIERDSVHKAMAAY